MKIAILFIACCVAFCKGVSAQTLPQKRPRLSHAEDRICISAAAAYFGTDCKILSIFNFDGFLKIDTDRGMVELNKNYDLNLPQAISLRRIKDQKRNDTPTTQEQCLGRSKVFLLQKYNIDLSQWTTDRIHYPAFPDDEDYEVNFSRYVSGIRTPSLVSISYNIWEDRVVSYLLIDEPIQIPVTWTLSQAQALSIAKTAVDSPRAAVVQSELIVSRSGEMDPEPWQQKLAWKFLLSRGTLFRVFVDAQTGEMLCIQRSAGGGAVSRNMYRIAKNIPARGLVERAKFPITLFEQARRKQKSKAK